MWLSLLEIKDVRNLRDVALEPAPGMNLLWGPNGSGKTSVLEAIHLLGVGRSFQTTQANTFVRHGESRALVFGKVRDDGRERRLGIEKDVKGRTEIRVDGQKAESAAALAEHLPLILFTPRSHELMEGGPGERRAYLDWGLFHVEQSFLPTWRRYQRYLKQRNAALSAGDGLAQWDEGLAKAGEELSSLRERYVASVTPFFHETMRDLGPELSEFTLEYRPGWASGPLLESLHRNLDKDRRDGFTHGGPHRSELRIKVAGRPATAVLSRGQEKLAIAGLRLAQLEHLRATVEKSAVVLVDDLPAELDKTHRRRFLETLVRLGAQVFITATDPELLETNGFTVRMFHVEHGLVQPVV